MNAAVSDNLNIPFTVIKKTDGKTANAVKNAQCLEESRWKDSYKNGTLVIEIENVKLVQAPSEILNMRVEIYRAKDAHSDSSSNTFRTSSYLSVQYTSIYHHIYYIELQFLNYLHEFNKNYRYEIICKITDHNHQKDEQVFTFTELRDAGCVKSGKRYVSVVEHDLTSPSEKLYFCIRRRFNETNDMICDERMHRAISTFRNTGCDVVLGAKDDDVRTHKSILSQNSEVFRTMFSIEMKEKQSGIIDVSDFEKRVVNKMLDYLYTGKIGELEDMTEALFKLAHRYQLHELCRRCEEYYTFNVKVDNDNIVEILKLTDLYELENLNECAVNFTKCHEQELIQVPGYREYLIQSINLDNVVAMLLLSEKYGLKDIKIECFDFIMENYRDMMEKEDFLNLFGLNALLMKEIYVYMHKKKL